MSERKCTGSFQQEYTRVLTARYCISLFVRRRTFFFYLLCLRRYLSFLFRAQASELWVKGEKVTCGYISEDTRVSGLIIHDVTGHLNQTLSLLAAESRKGGTVSALCYTAFTFWGTRPDLLIHKLFLPEHY